MGSTIRPLSDTRDTLDHRHSIHVHLWGKNGLSFHSLQAESSAISFLYAGGAVTCSRYFPLPFPCTYQNSPPRPRLSDTSSPRRPHCLTMPRTTGSNATDQSMRTLNARESSSGGPSGAATTGPRIEFQLPSGRNDGKKWGSQLSDEEYARKYDAAFESISPQSPESLSGNTDHLYSEISAQEARIRSIMERPSSDPDSSTVSHPPSNMVGRRSEFATATRAQPDFFRFNSSAGDGLAVPKSSVAQQPESSRSARTKAHINKLLGKLKGKSSDRDE